MNPSHRIACILFLLAGGTSSSAQSNVLFSTSFEGQPVGSFTSLRVGPLKLLVKGTGSISSRYAHTGKKCLHLLGDRGNTLTLEIPPRLQMLRGISFRAERWTRRPPFGCSLELLRDGKWQRLAKLDHAIQVGARFLSHIRLSIDGKKKTQAIRFTVKAAPKSGLLIDDLALHRRSPKRPTKLPSGKLPTKPLKLLASQTLFTSGTRNTHTFRIPAIITANNGDLIAACDARRKSSADLGKQRTIDIVYRRSTDNGLTWSPMKVLDTIRHGGCSDPSLLLDRQTGTIFCFYNFMSSDRSSKEYRFFVQRSVDHGKTWGKPLDFTDQVATPDLKNSFKFITSGRAIQTSSGLLLHNFVRVSQGITVFGSSNHGRTWKKISEVSPGDESKLVQLPDGSWMINSRIGLGRRHVHRSVDRGASWRSEADFTLPDPRCNGSILQYRHHAMPGQKPLLFCNAASNRGRKNLAIRYSNDLGKTWSDGKVIDRGPSAYSEITILKDGTLGVLYEPGYKSIRFVRFKLDEVLK